MDTRRTLKRTALVAALIGAVAVWSGYSEFSPGPYDVAAEVHAVSPDEVVATVDGQSVTRGDVDAAIDAMLGPQLRTLPDEQRAAVRAQLASNVLEGLIEKKLLDRAVDKEGIEIDADEIAAALERITAKLPPGKTMDAYLADTGLSQSDLENEIAQGLRVQKWFDARTADVTDPTDAEIKARYDRDRERFAVPETVEARHILIAIDAADDAEASAQKKAKAERIRQELVDGRSFEEAAKAVSDCPSRDRGGELGAFTKGELVPRFEEAAFSQKVGEIGPVVETRFGFHVIQVQKHTEAKAMELAEVQADIADELRAEKEHAAIEAAIARLRKAATVTYAKTAGAAEGSSAEDSA